MSPLFFYQVTINKRQIAHRRLAFLFFAVAGSGAVHFDFDFFG
jgi:hypothetical protein